jgi:anti-sigma28 factor (negative regulator of flagellin synthesis)
MKIPGSTGDEKKVNLNSEHRTTEHVHGKHLGILKRAQEAGTEGTTAQQTTDSVTVSELGAKLSSDLDPAKMAEERRVRVENLKKRIQEGTYQPPLQDVARSMSEELSLEILLSDQGGLDQENDNGLL